MYKLTAGRGLLDMERIKIVDSLISALGVRFEDTSTEYGLLEKKSWEDLEMI